MSAIFDFAAIKARAEEIQKKRDREVANPVVMDSVVVGPVAGGGWNIYGSLNGTLDYEGS